MRPKALKKLYHRQIGQSPCSILGVTKRKERYRHLKRQSFNHFNTFICIIIVEFFTHMVKFQQINCQKYNNAKSIYFPNKFPLVFSELSLCTLSKSSNSSKVVFVAKLGDLYPILFKVSETNFEPSKIILYLFLA